VPRVVELSCGPDQGGVRLDVFLAGAAAGLTRSAAQRLIAGGAVTVAGKTARPSTRLRGGEVVAVGIPDPVEGDDEARPESIPLEIVYEDRDLAVINKARGMVVHPAAGHRGGTLVNALLARWPDIAGVGPSGRPGIVHRLDRDTSGLMVVARTAAAYEDLARQVKDRQVERQYLALVRGAPPAAGAVDAPLGRHPRDRKRMAVVAGGRPARTHFTVLERLGGASLVRARLETGRTHQIRVHMAHIGCPVLGDPVYGRRRADPPEVAGLLRGQALHAERIAFSHPADGRRLEFQAPPPADFTAALDALRAKKGGDGGAG
jgi:23S rRNA pseudouridine1911/1915/1917 synthase